METSKKRGIIYTRVSSSQQVDNTSLESQERICREFALRQGIEVAEVFVEEGESAKTADRTEFNRAIAFSTNKRNKIQFFIVYKVDRFARNQDDHAIVRSTLKKSGVGLLSATEPIDNSPLGRLTEGVLSSFAEFDNSIRRQRSMGGMQELVRKGIWAWQAPLGYKRIGGKGSNLVIDEPVARYIRLAFEEYAKGTYSYKSLASFLNKHGFKTKSGRGACAQLMEKMLKNPLYYGVIRVWDTEVIGTFEPIISEELFYKCQEGYKNKNRNPSRSIINPEFPLKRICICTECTRPFTGSKPRGRNGTHYPHYHHQVQGCPKAKFIPKENFEQMFVEYLNSISPDAQFAKLFKSVVMDIWKTNYKKFDQENARLRKEVEKLESERQKIFDFHREGKYTDQEFLEQKERVVIEITQRSQLIQENHVEEFDMDEALTYCFMFVRETSQTWLKLKERNFGHLLRFQKQIFPAKIKFDGKKFGTDNLSLIYKINKESCSEKSKVVTLWGFEPQFHP